jgi:hypothetical protein
LKREEILIFDYLDLYHQLPDCGELLEKSESENGDLMAH